ncbi:MAG: hypothetical protein J7641_07395 [Cyanobacteria bacterium SID2]|nr:hypothetical protein [Cyanobacteria bacterium SID2]MBP0005509.1 hypothetical protein [Cyanobacteria bacterium SBC]
MAPNPDRQALATAFRRECSTRRTLNVLEIKRQRIRDDLRQMLRHMSLVVPSIGNGDTPSDVLDEALARLGDPTFAEFLRHLIEDG